MPFHIEPVVEIDIPRLIEIEFAAYRANAEAMLLRGRDPGNPAHIERARRRYSRMLTHDPRMAFMKAVDDGKRTVGWLRWEHIDPFDHTRDPAHEFDAWPIEGTATEAEMTRAYWASFEFERRELMGMRPHCYLANLVVDPVYQRQGVAKLLLARFLEEVDQLGLSAYLDSSPVGRRLYETNGFVWQQDGVFDMAAYGPRRGVRTHSIMIREPKSPAAMASQDA